MNGRIILSRADFSANNIGRYVEISDLAKKVLSKQTQYDVESEEAIALNTFLNNLTTDGFIGGESPLLQCLIIPGLANSHDELLYNIASLDNNGYPTNAMHADEISGSVKAFAPYENGGYKVALARYAEQGAGQPSANQDKVYVKWLSQSYDNWPSKSMIFYSLGIGPVSSSANEYIRNAGPHAHPVIDPSAIKLVYGATGKVVTNVTQANNSKPYLGFNGINYVARTKFEGVFDNVTIGTTTLDSDLDTNMDTGTTEVSYNSFKLGTYVYNYSMVLPFLAFGDYIPLEKMTTLKGYVNTLLTALHVI